MSIPEPAPKSYWNRIKAKLLVLARASRRGRSKDTYLAQSVEPEASCNRLDRWAYDQEPLGDAVSSFYRHQLQTNLEEFEKFALQSRSRSILNIFAREATKGRHSLASLSRELSDYLSLADQIERAHPPTVDSEILLALASLLVNGAQDDLDKQTGLLCYEFVLVASGESAFALTQKLEYVEALGDLGRYREQEKLARVLNIHDSDPLQMELLKLNRLRGENATAEAWVEKLNCLYRSLGMSAVRLLRDATLPLMDRLVSDATHSIRGPKISVIMPSYCPGAGIYTAVRSLLQQTWRNLEIIIVNDGSPDSYTERFEHVASLDSRILVVNNNENLGAYVARNHGLAIASGEYVTVHDDDDWSHPDKLALQASVLCDNGHVMATTSEHIRTSEHLVFQRLNMRPRYLQKNFSSLMVRKTLFNTIGLWDDVNRAGDVEFETRLEQNISATQKVDISGKPLAFSRTWDGSLTSGEMSRGHFAYSRILYRWSFRQWQWSQRRLGLRAVRDRDSARPYAIPSSFSSVEDALTPNKFDLIYVADFFRQSKFVNSVIQEIETAVDEGFTVAYMHINSPTTQRRAGIAPKLFELQLEGKIFQVAESDEAATSLLVVYDAAIGMFLDQAHSNLQTDKAITIIDRPATLEPSDGREATSILQALHNLDRCFDTRFQVIGTTERVNRGLMRAVPPRRFMGKDYQWHSHVRLPASEIEPPRSVPVVGFHTFGNVYRWPSNQRTLEEIYFSDSHVTKFYGQLNPLLKKFGDAAVSGAEVVDFEVNRLETFLSSIDFWVYFPHDRLQSTPWLPVLEAMQAGKVVILPWRLRPVYGDAAVYSEPSDVSKVVAELSSSPQSYVAQAHLGQEFVAMRHDKRCFIKRLNRAIAG